MATFARGPVKWGAAGACGVLGLATVLAVNPFAADTVTGFGTDTVRRLRTVAAELCHRCASTRHSMGTSRSRLGRPGDGAGSRR